MINSYQFASIQIIMEFYHEIITEKSFKILQDLKRQFDFILIGGWAVFLYARTLKSKDIDIIVDYNQLAKLKRTLDVSKNERLKKYEAKIEEVDIDIYLPHYSNIGFPIEEIKNYFQSVEGFKVPLPEVLLILKTYVWSQRKNTSKGKKDLIDIFSILSKDVIDWGKYKRLIEKYNLAEIDQQLKEIILSTKSISELNLLNHQMSRLKKKILSKLT